MVTAMRRGFGLLVGPMCVVGCLITLLVLAVNQTCSQFEDWFQVERQARLAREEKASRLRQARRKEAIWALIDGRIPLVEAAAICAELRAEVVVLKELEPPIYAGYPHEEQECMFAIDLTGDELFNQPSLARTVRERLKAELQELRKHRPIRLPPARPVAAKEAAQR